VGNPTVGKVNKERICSAMNSVEKKKEYGAKLDSKKRLTIRGA
jgi:hypothetical protein